MQLAARIGKLKPARPPGSKPIGNPVRNIVLTYAVLGCLWIAFSDRILAALVRNPDQIILYGMLKGCFFVGFTSIVLYRLIKVQFCKVRRHEAQLGALLETIPDLIWLKNSDGYYLECNRAFEQFNDCDRGSMLQRRAEEFLPRSVADFIEAQDRRVFENGETVLQESVIQRIGRDGVLLETVRTPILGEDGAILGLLGIGRDITARKAMEETLRESERFLLMSQRIAAIGSCVLDLRTGVVTPSPVLAELFGFDSSDPTPVQSFLECIHLEDRASVESLLWEQIEAGGPFEVQYRVARRSDGAVRFVHSRGEVELGEDGTPLRLVATVQDVTDITAAHERIESLRHFDELTGLPNRSQFRDRVEQTIHGLSTDRDRVALFFLDLDQFKTLNDNLGHAVGDAILQVAAKRIRACLGARDILARTGGDEFAILAFQESDSPRCFESLADSILAAFHDPFILVEGQFQLSVSIGISCYPDHSLEPEELLRFADLAMFQAKEHGRARHAFYLANLGKKSIQRLQVGSALRTAIERSEFALFYQPIVDVPSGRTIGAEALIRWFHPELGTVPPDQFIGIAEETNLILPIGRWVLETACAKAAEWLKTLSGPFVISVNLSPKQFADPNLVAMVRESLAQTGLPPHSLQLEITETQLMENPEHGIAVMSELSRLGVLVAIDDFGTGYSSLAYLNRFPIHCLKIDRSFTKNVPQDANSVAISQAIIALAHSLKLKIVAEGVETVEQLEFLASHRCDSVQGYFFSKPVPELQLEPLLNTTWDTGQPAKQAA